MIYNGLKYCSSGTNVEAINLGTTDKTNNKLLCVCKYKPWGSFLVFICSLESFCRDSKAEKKKRSGGGEKTFVKKPKKTHVLIISSLFLLLLLSAQRSHTHRNSLPFITQLIYCVLCSLYRLRAVNLEIVIINFTSYL